MCSAHYSLVVDGANSTRVQTRSERVFSPWGGEVIKISDPAFDLSAVVRHRVEEEDALEALDAYDPFDSQSPLSSPPTTPCTSRAPSPSPDTEIFAELSVLAPPTPRPPPPATSKNHSKRQSRENRKRKRRKKKTGDRLTHHPDIPPRLRSKHTHAAEPLVTDFDVADAPHASSGYVGLVEESWKREHTLEELTGPKFNFWHCKWQGQ